MSLKERIKQYGFEIEYPISGSIEYVKEELQTKYHLHYDGNPGIEFTTPQPLNYDDMLSEVHTIYDICAKILAHDPDVINIPLLESETGATNGEYSLDECEFESNDNGIHIRIDVSDWTKQERKRFCRLLSHSMDDFDDYTEWAANHFHRGWNNYNEPGDYRNIRQHIDNDHTSEKFANVKYEYGRYGTGVATIEIRAFGVVEDADTVELMFEFIHTLCDIVDKSLTYPVTIPALDCLVHAWNDVIEGITYTPGDEVDTVND